MVALHGIFDGGDDEGDDEDGDEYGEINSCIVFYVATR